MDFEEPVVTAGFLSCNRLRIIMKIITSKENKVFKSMAQLKQKKQREKQGKYLIEGPNLVIEALKNEVMLQALAVKNSWLLRDEIQNIVREYGALGYSENSIVLLEDRLFDSLTDTEHPQGIYGVVEQPYMGAAEFFKLVGAGNIAVLDKLQDAGNVGTIIRTAEAAGYRGIISMKGTADIYAPKVVRAATGSLFRLPVMFADAPEDIIKELRGAGKQILAADMEGDKFYYEHNLKENIALIVGNEGNGICEEFKAASHIKIKIPMMGETESLNVSVAAAIIMYEGLRR